MTNKSIWRQWAALKGAETGTGSTGPPLQEQIVNMHLVVKAWG